MKKPNLNFTKMLIAFAVAFFFSLNSFSQTPTVIRGPYLQSGTSTSTIVQWRTSDNTDSQVWYGTDANNLNQTEVVSGSQADHQVTISGLTANTIYYYAVGNSGGQMEGGNGDASYYFKTAPTIGSSQPVTAWILGDCGTADLDQEKVRDAYYNFIGNNHTDMVLLLGDNAYDDGFDSEYQDAIFDIYPDKLKNSIFWSCPGNHDYFGSGLNNAYYDIFSFPKNGEAGGLASNTEKYYSFDYANIHMISLDSHDENRSPGSPMLTWLENDLAATTQEWIVVIFHHPPYSKGSHDSDDTSENRMIEMRENVLPICESYGVDLVLTGHSHSYERSKLINGHYGFSNTYDPALHDVDGGNGQLNGTGAYQQNTSIEGTVYVVTGSAGGLDPVGNHPVMYSALESLGSAILEVNGGQMDVKFLNENGVVGDSLTLIQNGQPVINWASPSNGSLFTNLDPVVLNVDAFDSNGNIAQVEYFANGVSIGIDAIAPYSLNWAPIVFGNFLLKATATDNEGNSTSKEISITFDNTNPTSLTVPINDEDDDAEESEGDMAVNSSDLDLVEDGQNEQTVGLVFNNLNIPQGAIITNAYIQFTTDDTGSESTNLTIHGEATDNALSFATTDFNITSRPITSASVNWAPPAWNSQGETGVNQQTPDLSILIQEIVDRTGWLENNSMGFIISGIGTRNAYSYDGSSSNAAVLQINFAINPCAPFFDLDKDGYCSDVDCDDTDPTISPGVTEICDGIDNNCDGQIDEGLSNIYFADTDADGFGDPNNSIQDCSLPSGYVLDNTDCDDTDGNINPGVAEVCDGIDNNCDGQIDEGVSIVYFADTDTDGFGDPNNSVEACTLPLGYVLDNTDCDDTDVNVNPNATEICDGIDNNCDGQIDEGLLITYFADTDADGFGDPNNSIQACSLPANYVLDNTDCDDTNSTVNSGRTEVCDGLDNNCDGQIDEDLLITYFADTDADGFGDENNSLKACTVPSGYVSDNTDCDDTNSALNPGTIEVCDGIDNNCDGQIDEQLLNTYYLDIDGDGFGDQNNSIQACTVPSGYVADNTDCDDNNASVNSSETEICDGVDNNCDGQIDEGLLNIYYVDTDNDGFGDPNNSVLACTIPSGYVSNNIDCDDTASNIYTGAVCDDNNPNSINDIYNSDCICIGDFAPTVNWTSPTEGQFFTNLNQLSLNVEAIDNDGDITQVEYFANGISIGTDVIAPYSFNWIPPTYGSFLLKTTATDNGGNITSEEISIMLQDISPTNLVIQISEGDDDAEESTGDMILSSSDLEMVEDGSDDQTVGLVFNGITVPAGAIIANAYIQFTTDETDSGSTNLTIHGEDTDNALSFTSSDFNLTSRPTTSASVNWVPPSWSSEGEAGINQRTPDLSILVQEIVDRSGWAENNSMGFIISGVGNRTAVSYNGSATDAAILHITFGINPCEPFFDMDKDGFCSDIDCDDTNPNINSGAVEICDGIDNNCNGQVDEGVMISYFEDTDNDGFGDPNNSLQACTIPSGYVLDNTDCDDTNPNINSGATEICDGVDNNCDGQIDEGLLIVYFVDIDNDGFGDPTSSIQACSLPSGYVLNNTDCDDTDVNVNPSVIEVCDGVDNNCDGQIDEGLLNTYFIDIDNDGFGDGNNSIEECSLPTGYVSNNTDCDDTNENINPNATEVCDGVDNNCDGQIDEGLLNTYFADIDTDGFGDPNNSLQACSLPSGYVSDNTDCNDTDGDVNSSATEICDGIDNNCDGQIDEGLSTNTYYADGDNDGFGDANNFIEACSLPTGYVSNNTDCDDTNGNVNPNTTEICDGVDNNCDGQIDESLLSTYFADTDTDGFGDPNNTLQACSLPSGYVLDNTDCNDTDGSVYPSAIEICDEIDNNCDGQVDEGLSTNIYYADTDTDGFGDPNNSIQACSLPTGYVSDNTDCDDTASNIYIGATCDDSDPNTINDIYDNNCICIGAPLIPPTVNWTNPTEGQFFTNLNPIGLDVNAFDSDGSIVQIEYFVNGVSIGIDVAEPYSFSWIPITYGNYLLKTTATDNQGNTGSEEISITLQDNSPTSIAIQINDEDDDAEESTGDMNLNSSDLEMVEDGSDEQTVGLVFNEINIPAGAIITNAYIQFTTDETDSGSTNLTIHGEDTDNSLSFTSSDFNLTSRPTTVSVVNWTPLSWSSEGEAGVNQQTPDLSSLVQEIVDRAAWEENNSMGFIISGSGNRTAVSYDGDSEDAATLHVTFTLNPCGTFFDLDNDGFCSDIDCDDTNPAINSGAIEVCDGIDNNCNGQIDEGALNTYFADNDADGFGDSNNSLQACTIPSGYVSDNTDCDDTDGSVNPNATEICDGIDNNCDGQIDEGLLNTYFADNDADGFGDPNNSLQACTIPSGYVSDDTDCDDTNGSVNLSVIEICDGIDNNCDGQIDENLLNTYFADGDNDGFGDPNNSLQACTIPSGYVLDNTDCDDTNGSVNPNATEICDGIDNNCDGQIDEGLNVSIYYLDGDNDGFGDFSNSIQSCTIPTGYVLDNTDCDDTNGSINSNATEICDGIDNNCDGQIDEGLSNTIYYLDGDNDGFGDANNSIQSCSISSGYVLDNTDCDDTNGSVNPNAIEICDGIDNNCDGQIDEGLFNTYYADGDNDGFGDANNSIQACSVPSGYVSDNTDCDDTDGSINPSATEICDGLDSNCNGQIDEGVLNTYYADTDSDGFGDVINSIQACSLPSGYVLDNTDCDDTNGSINSGATEICDGLDNNCDGQVDEGLSNNTYYADTDTDGFGDPNHSVQDCALPSGYVLDNTDCDDTASNIYIGATCDDNDSSTTNDIYNINCICVGVPLIIPPTITWTNPINGQFFTNLDPIELTVNAFDVDGNITQVEYFVNGISIGIDVVAPYSFNWIPPAYESYLLKATATDNGGNISSAEISITLQDISPTSISIQINDEDDDAEETTGDMNLTSSDLEMTEDGSDEQTVGLVFNEVNIPVGVEITNAYIQFTTDETDSESTNLTIHGEDTDNSLSFTSSDFNLTSRPTTSASINWIPPIWSSEGEAGIDQQTPDLSSLIQEIVDRSGWEENNSMGFIISGVGVRTAVSYNGSPNDAAILHVTFSIGTNPCEPFFDADNDGFCSDIDCDDTDASVNPNATETCDGLDNNCNGQIDEGVMITFYADTDTDGFGDLSNLIEACSLPSGYVLDNTDCDDTDSNIYIGATCDDSNPNTINDIYDSNCICIGDPLIIPPTVSWITPINGQVFTNLTSIALNVAASDSDGNIVQVEYFVNGVSIGIDEVAPYSFSWIPLAYESYLLKTTATDNGGNTSSAEISITLQDNTPTSITVQINNEDDDAEESTGDMNLTSSDLEMVEDGQDEQTVGLVFNGLNIPAGAVIANAYIQFTVDETDSESTNLTIHGEDTDNALSFTTSDFNLTSRPTTVASINWIPSEWPSEGEAGIDQQTPDLSALVQEIVDRSDWEENNSMGFIISGVGVRTAISYDGSPEDAAVLHVTFSTAPPVIGPTINWTNPNEGQVFTNLNSINLNVDAFDSNGSVTQVEYFINGISIGIDLAAPYSLSWIPPSFGNYVLKATATDNDGNTSSEEISIILQDGTTTSTSIAIQINNEDDDAEESTGDMNLTSSDLEMVEDGQDEQTVGLVFNELNIPTGAVITNAYIQFTADETDSESTNLTIHGEDTDNALSFTTSDFNLTSRSTTSASVNWIPSEWSSEGEAGLDQQTPDLSSLVQEIVDRSGWEENNSMGFIVSGIGVRTAVSYNGSPTDAATLHVTFEISSSSSFVIPNDDDKILFAESKLQVESIDLQEKSTLHFFPNPIKDLLNIHYKTISGETTYVELIDLNGKRVVTQNIQIEKGNNKFQMDLSEMPNGLYFLRLVEGENHFLKKMVINR